jgi:UDP-N-acetylglucosamine 2-epimerase (non-hydrolysing)
MGHVESGLRIGYRGMLEEINKILRDHLSNYLFAPTKNAYRNLIDERISKEKIF